MDEERVPAAVERSFSQRIRSPDNKLLVKPKIYLRVLVVAGEVWYIGSMITTIICSSGGELGVWTTASFISIRGCSIGTTSSITSVGVCSTEVFTGSFAFLSAQTQSFEPREAHFLSLMQTRLPLLWALAHPGPLLLQQRESVHLMVELKAV